MGQARRYEEAGRDKVRWIEPVEAAVSAADYFECGRHPRHYSRRFTVH
jgi:hypothetical protein